MLILEEESEKVVRGYPQREVIYKRLHWQDEGSYFVYQSSVPDAIHPDVDFAEDDAIRYDLIHQTTCFKQVGASDILMDRVMQIDFRQAQSNAMIQGYVETQDNLL